MSKDLNNKITLLLGIAHIIFHIILRVSSCINRNPFPGSGVSICYLTNQPLLLLPPLLLPPPLPLSPELPVLPAPLSLLPLPLGGLLLPLGGVPDVDGGVSEFGLFGFCCVGQVALASITDPSGQVLVVGVVVEGVSV